MSNNPVEYPNAAQILLAFFSHTPIVEYKCSISDFNKDFKMIYIGNDKDAQIQFLIGKPGGSNEKESS